MRIEKNAIMENKEFSVMESFTKSNKWMLPISEIRARDLYFYNLPINKYISTTECEVEELGKMILFSGYSYLSLHNHPYIAKRTTEIIQVFGTGGHGARTLTGTTSLHLELEKKIAHFKSAEDAITFSSGYICNLSVISALASRGDTILTDYLNHGSIVDGCTLSGAKVRLFRHNDMEHLEELLSEKNEGNVLVIADAIFSMKGSIFNLPVASKLCKKYGALLMMDECHSVGTLGKTGRGIEEHFGLPSSAVDIKMGTFSKSIPSQGGYVAGNKKIIDFLRHNARSRLMSGANTPPIVAAAIASLEIIEQEPERVEKLRHNIMYTNFKLKQAELETLPSQTAIIPILIGNKWKALEMTKYCIQQGIYLQAIHFPIVPLNKAILRLSINTDHTKEQIDKMIEVVKSAKWEIE